MCLIVCPEKVDGKLVLTDENLRFAGNRNNDGWGFMWLEDDNMVDSMRGYGVEALVKAYHELKDKPGLCVHVRMKTSGPICEENTHPFLIGEDTFMMHNGVLRIDELYPDRSDTWHMAQLMTARFNEEETGTDAIFNDKKWLESMNDYCRGSKLVFLRGDGQRCIVNEDDGVVYEGHWYSNTYSAPWVKTSSSGFTRTIGGFVWRSGEWEWGDDDKTPCPVKVKTSGDVCALCRDSIGLVDCDLCNELYCKGCREDYQGGSVCLECLLDEEEEAVNEDLGGGSAGEEGKQAEKAGPDTGGEGNLDLGAEPCGGRTEDVPDTAQCDGVRVVERQDDAGTCSVVQGCRDAARGRFVRFNGQG